MHELFILYVHYRYDRTLSMHERFCPRTQKGDAKHAHTQTHKHSLQSGKEEKNRALHAEISAKPGKDLL